MLPHRLKPLLANSAAVPVLIVVLILDFVFLMSQPAGSRGSAAQWIIDHNRPRRCCGGGGDPNRRSLRFEFFRQSDGSVVISETNFWSPSSRSIDHAILLVDFDDSGLYAPTKYCRWAKVIGPSIPELLPRQRELREDILDRAIGTLGVMNVGARRQALIDGKVAHLDGISILGIAHNTFAFSTFLLLCWSFALNAHKLHPAYLFAFSRTYPADQCPHCRYSTIGLTNDVCPECGNRIALSD